MGLWRRLRRIEQIWRSEIREVGNEARILSAIAFLISFAVTT
jgi:hypothetical protein